MNSCKYFKGEAGNWARIGGRGHGGPKHCNSFSLFSATELLICSRTRHTHTHTHTHTLLVKWQKAVVSGLPVHKFWGLDFNHLGHQAVYPVDGITLNHRQLVPELVQHFQVCENPPTAILRSTSTRLFENLKLARSCSFNL